MRHNPEIGGGFLEPIFGADFWIYASSALRSIQCDFVNFSNGHFF